MTRIRFHQSLEDLKENLLEFYVGPATSGNERQEMDQQLHVLEGMKVSDRLN